jgi:hypothetical protein
MLDAAGNPGDDGNPENDRFLFNNHTSPVGSIVNLGMFAAGTELMFRLRVKNTNQDYFTGPASRNPDNHVHARVQANWMPGQALVSFEDLHNGPFHYNDLAFSFAFLPSPHSYTPAIPPALTAPPIAALPVPSTLVERVSTDPVSILNSMREHISSSAKDALEAVIDVLVNDPLPKGVKTLFNEAANTLEVSLNGGSALAGFLNGRNALSLSERVISLAQATSDSFSVVDVLGSTRSSHWPELAGELANARLAAEVLTLGWTTWAGASPAQLLLMANLIVWGDILPAQMRKFAVDPPDAAYSRLVDAIVPTLLPVANAGSPRANEYFTRLNATTLKAAGLLDAVNTSYDRYTAAHEAGDAASAVLQLTAWLHYVTEVRNVLREAEDLFGQAGAVMESLGFKTGPPDAALVASTRNDLQKAGLPPELKVFLTGLGFDEARLTRITQDIAAAAIVEPDVPDLSRTLALVASALLQAANGKATTAQVVPVESTTISDWTLVLVLLLVACGGLGIVLLRRKS